MEGGIGGFSMGAMGGIGPHTFYNFSMGIRFLPYKLSQLRLCGPHSHEYFPTPLEGGIYTLGLRYSIELSIIFTRKMQHNILMILQYKCCQLLTSCIHFSYTYTAIQRTSTDGSYHLINIYTHACSKNHLHDEYFNLQLATSKQRNQFYTDKH